MGAKLTTEIVNQRIIHTGITMIGEYITDGEKSLFKCKNDHTWLAMPKNVLRGKGCPHCYGNASLSTEIVNDRIKHRNIIMIEEYTTAHTLALFICEKNHQWRSSVNSVMRGCGCPSCARHGFNPSKSAHAYILSFGSYVKYGITNNLEQRLSQHRRYNGKFEIKFSQFYDSGKDALMWEKSIKQKHGGSYVTEATMPDGWTETLSIEKLKEII